MMLLRLGMYEILFMNGIPPRATVHELVGIARHHFGQRVSGLVNAVLRNVARSSSSILAEIEVRYDAARKPSADAETLAYAGSLPLWLVQKWISQYGREKTIDFVCHAEEHPALCWRVNRQKPWADMLVQHWCELGYSPVGEDGFSAQGMDKNKTNVVREKKLLETFEKQGNLTRQGAGSQLLAEYLSNWIRKHEKLAQAEMWDACCGRGGKTTALLEKGVRVSLATDPSSFRIDELKKSVCRLNLSMPRIKICPAQEIFEKFSLILLDVPCSGTGTLGRNAELRCRLSPEKLSAVAEMQRSILDHTWEQLQKNGVIFYVTCALNYEENEEQIQHFLEKHSQTAVLLEQKLFMPQFSGQDILFVAILNKVGENRV
jgi:16S rRNA (cytosine967-C5)-methyltransferase